MHCHAAAYERTKVEKQGSVSLCTEMVFLLMRRMLVNLPSLQHR